MQSLGGRASLRVPVGASQYCLTEAQEEGETTELISPGRAKFDLENPADRREMPALGKKDSIASQGESPKLDDREALRLISETRKEVFSGANTCFHRSAESCGNGLSGSKNMERSAMRLYHIVMTSAN